MQNKITKPEKTISLSNLPSIITAVVLIVGIGAVYGLVGYLFSGIEENVTPVIQVPIDKSDLDKIEKPVVFEEEENISDWEVYRNEKYGFEIKYPNNWIIEKNSEESINFWTEDRYKLNSEMMFSKGASHLSHNLGIEVANEKWSKEKIDENLKNNEIQKEEIYLNNIKIIKFLKKSDEGNIYLNCIQKNNIYIVIYKNDSTSEKEFNQILSTFKFTEEDETVFQKSDRIGFFGTLTLTGYLDIERWVCDENGMCSETVDYAFFVVKDTSSDLIYDFINDSKGNSFVGNNSIGIGCYDKDKNIIHSMNSGDSGTVENIISGEDIYKLLGSNKNNLVKLKLTKPTPPPGGGAPECYSHFRLFQVL